MKTRTALATVALAAAVGATARGDVVFGDFESGTLPGWGWLTGDSRGIIPWSPPDTGPANAAIITGSGALPGNVLQVTGDGSFNMGQASGAVVAFDFVPQNFRQAFLDHDQIEFDWYPPPNAASTSGWSQLWNVIVNSEAGGWVSVDGYSFNNPSGEPPVDKSHLNQYYYDGYPGILHHVVVDYSALKNTILNSATPDGGGWLQLGLQLNPGGGAPGEMWFDNFKFTLAAEIWNVDAGGTWSTDTNWSRGTHPNAPGKVATFGPVITAPQTVTVDAAKTVGQINFNNANKYTISGSALTLDSASNVGITVSNGSHDITAPLALAKDANINISAAGSTLTISNLQPTAVNITKSGAGVLAVNNIRAGSMNVNAGQLTVLANGGAAGASKVGALSIAPGAKLDLKDNKLITTTAAGSASGGTYSGVQGMVQSASNGGAWDGNGLTTSMPDAAGGLTSIGVATGEQVRGLGPTDTDVFAGQTINGASTVAMYTYAGDANLDGQITGDDYSSIDFNIAVPGADGWYNGDFNYDGIISGDDYSVIDFNIVAQGAPFSTGGAAAEGVAAVPEPSSAMLLSLGAAAMLRRRRVR